MANGKVLRQLIKAGTIGDAAAFRRVSETIIEGERQKQHHLLANDLRNVAFHYWILSSLSDPLKR